MRLAQSFTLKAEAGLFDAQLEVLAHFVAAQHGADAQCHAGLAA